MLGIKVNAQSFSIGTNYKIDEVVDAIGSYASFSVTLPNGLIGEIGISALKVKHHTMETIKWNEFNINLKYIHSTNQYVDFYPIVGWCWDVKKSKEYNNNETSHNLNVGAGLDFKLGKKFSIVFEYLRNVDFKNSPLNFKLGLKYNFKTNTNKTIIKKYVDISKHEEDIGIGSEIKLT